MNHLHTPERLRDESFSDYVARRNASRLSNERAARGTRARQIAASDAKRSRRALVRSIGRRQAIKLLRTR